MRTRFCATMRRPACSIIALIAPVRLRAVASGLMIEKVRSIAIGTVLVRGDGGCGGTADGLVAAAYSGRDPVGQGGTNRRSPTGAEQRARALSLGPALQRSSRGARSRVEDFAFDQPAGCGAGDGRHHDVEPELLEPGASHGPGGA